MYRNSPKRIGLCVYDTSTNRVGGPMFWAQDLSISLIQHGFELQFFILQDGTEQTGKLTHFCINNAISYSILDTAKFNYIEPQVHWIVEQAQSHKIDILVANLVLPAMYAAKYLRPDGTHTITVLHSDPNHDAYYRDVVDRLLSSKDFYPDVVVSVATFIDNELLYRIPKPRFQRAIIPCGAPPATNEGNIACQLPKLIYAGRLINEQKRIKETTEALIQTCETLKIAATICGDGPERSWLENRLKTQKAVTYLGLLPPNELRAIMRQHHAFVLLSDYEGMSVSLTEAMSLGVVPICLEKINGLNEIIEHNHNGLIVKNRETDFLEAVGTLCNQSTWERLSENAKATFNKNFSHDVTFRQWRTLLNTLHKKESFPKKQFRIRIPLHGTAFKGYPTNTPPRTKLTIEKLARALLPRTTIRLLTKHLRNMSTKILERN
jgi:colanic acid/amylovoran biosynthesis glycosyltransferase